YQGTQVISRGRDLNQPYRRDSLRVDGAVLAEEGEALAGLLDGQLQHPRQRREGWVDRHGHDSVTESARARSRVAVAVSPAGELAIVGVEGDQTLQDARVGEGIGQTLPGCLAREVEARGVQVAGVDEEAEAIRGRADVSHEARELRNGLAQLAALAGVLQEQARARGHLGDQLA